MTEPAKASIRTVLDEEGKSRFCIVNERGEAILICKSYDSARRLLEAKDEREQRE